MASAAALSLPNPFILQLQGCDNNRDGPGNTKQEELIKKSKGTCKAARARFYNP